MESYDDVNDDIFSYLSFFYSKVHDNNINKIKRGIPAKYWGIRYDIPILSSCPILSPC